MTPCDELYKVLAFRDQFNFVGVLDRGGFYYKLDMANLMNSHNAKFFKLLLVHFVQRLASFQDELITEYGDNKMQLFLDYEQLVQGKLAAYLSDEFKNVLLDVLRKLQV